MMIVVIQKVVIGSGKFQWFFPCVCVCVLERVCQQYSSFSFSGGGEEICFESRSQQQEKYRDYIQW